MDERLRGYLQEGELAGVRYALSPPRRAVVGLNGSQLGRSAGSSLEFREHREYQPGDDLRRLDWGAYARSDKLIVRLYEQEVQPHLDLVVDGSASMALEGTDKARATAALAALFATAASQAGSSHAAWVTDERCRRLANGAGRPSTWEGLSLDAKGNPHQALARQAPQWRPRSIRLLISDLLWMGEPREVLSRLGAGASSVLLVQVLARQDVSPVSGGFIKLVDSETGEVHAVYLDEPSVRQYKESFQRHMDAWYQACRRSGATLVSLVAEEIVSGWQLDPLVAAEVLQIKR